MEEETWSSRSKTSFHWCRPRPNLQIEERIEVGPHYGFVSSHIRIGHVKFMLEREAKYIMLSISLQYESNLTNANMQRSRFTHYVVRAAVLQMGHKFFCCSHCLMQLMWNSCPQSREPMSSPSAYSSYHHWRIRQMRSVTSS